jgi:diadenosine tetraphosphate (Ap4A) HIT family hydrolase
MTEPTEALVFESKHFTVSACLSCSIPGYLIVTAKEAPTSLAGLSPGAQAEFASVFAKASRLIEQSVTPERIYCLRFGEEVEAVHFHLFPRTRLLLDEYRAATGAFGTPSGPLIFDWARRVTNVSGGPPAPEVIKAIQEMRHLAEVLAS